MVWKGAPFRIRRAWPDEHGTAGAAVTSRQSPGSDGGGAWAHHRRAKHQPRPMMGSRSLLGATVSNE